MSATMAWSVVNGILVTVHSAAPPRDDEWTRYLRDAGTTGLTGNLVLTDGGGPNAMQRKQIEELPQIRLLPTAVVTTSRLVRGIVTAISWMGKNIRAVAPTALDAAFDYMQVKPVARASLLSTIERLRAQHKPAPSESSQAR